MPEHWGKDRWEYVFWYLVGRKGFSDKMARRKTAVLVGWDGGLVIAIWRDY